MADAGLSGKVNKMSGSMFENQLLQERGIADVHIENLDSLLL
jgi:hypothetical protein